MNTSLASSDKETKVNNENQTQINSSKNTLDSAEKFDNYTKLLNASAKLAEETKHLNKLIAEANTKLLIIARRKAIIESKQRALWSVNQEQYDKSGPYLYFTPIVAVPTVNTVAAYTYDLVSGTLRNINDDADCYSSTPSTPTSKSFTSDEEEDNLILDCINNRTPSQSQSTKRQKTE